MSFNEQRFVNEIMRTDERIRLYQLQIEVALLEYYYSMIDDLEDIDDDGEYLGVLGYYSSSNTFTDVTDETAKITKLYESELKEIKPRFGVNQEDADLTIEIAKNHQTKINSTLLSSVIALSSALALAKTLSGKRQTKRELKEQYIDPKLRQTETELVTQVNGYRSGMEIRKANEIEKQPSFAYVGPRDKLNRPLCRYILDKQQIWTEKQIKELDGHPDANIVPVMIYRGGYNCRHRWIYTGRE